MGQSPLGNFYVSAFGKYTVDRIYNSIAFYFLIAYYILESKSAAVSIGVSGNWNYGALYSK